MKDSYRLDVKVNGYKYLEDEIEVEEDIAFSVELFSNGEFSTNVVLMKDDSTNIFTFKKFVNNWKNEFNEVEDE